MLVVVIDRKLSQFWTELTLHQGYSMLLVGELQVACIPISDAPEIQGRRPIIPPFEQRYMLIPPGPPSSWGSFA